MTSSNKTLDIYIYIWNTVTVLQRMKTQECSFN